MPRTILRIIRHSLPALLLLLSIVCPPLSLAETRAQTPGSDQPYVFGSFPFLVQTDLEGIFTPLAAELSNALERPLRYESAASFDKFNQLLGEQRFDVAHIQPFDYVRFAVPAGYVPLVTRLETLSAAFVVKPESPLQKAGDLKGKKLGLPPKPSASTYLSRVALLQAGVDMDRDLTVQYFSTHQACLQQLLIGDVDVCSAGKPIIRFFEAEVGRPLRTILVTPQITQTLFVVHKRVPEAQRETIRKALIDTRLEGVSPNLRKLFLPGADEKGPYFRVVTDKEYDNVRQYLKLLGEK